MMSTDVPVQTLQRFPDTSILIARGTHTIRIEKTKILTVEPKWFERRVE